MTDFDPELHEMTDEGSLIVSGLMEGKATALAAYLDRGGVLHNYLRRCLVSFLRREFPRGRGRMRTREQAIRERAVRRTVLHFQWDIAARCGALGSRRRAIEAYMQWPRRDPAVSYETVEKYLGAGLNKLELDAVEELRREFLPNSKPNG